MVKNELLITHSNDANNLNIKFDIKVHIQVHILAIFRT
jgi:hypothetical protein